MDIIQSFLLQGGLVRGRVVAADQTVEDILKKHDYPKVLHSLIRESVVLALALASGLKYDGVFAFQIVGNGPVDRIFVDVTSDGSTRAYAVYDSKMLPDSFATLQDAFGNDARLMFSVGQVGHEPYQGVVALTGNNLSEAVLSYFKLSEQIETDLILMEQENQVRCLMLQKMPDNDRVSLEESEDVWETVRVLAHSVRCEELFDLTPDQVLFRLFHANGLVLQNKKTPSFFCRCRRDQMVRFLKRLPADQVSALEVDGKIKAVCQFCGASYIFTKDDLS